MEDKKVTPNNINELSETLSNKSTIEVLLWAENKFGKELVVTSSFQTQSIPLLHLISEYIPKTQIVFLDTGFHFPETLSFRDRLIEEFGLNVKSITNKHGHQAFLSKFGQLYKKDPDLCCRLNKVEPLNRELRGYRAWITGIRRDQTQNRKNTPIIELQKNGIYKIAPIVQWTRHDVWTYIHRNNLPEHPLLAKGYLSVGCAPCTQPSYGGDERSGRWRGSQKTECGLHTE